MFRPFNPQPALPANNSPPVLARLPLARGVVLFIERACRGPAMNALGSEYDAQATLVG